MLYQVQIYRISVRNYHLMLKNRANKVVRSIIL